jgi:1,4-dihydroxy-2-naphthoate octaprenyltransferase
VTASAAPAPPGAPAPTGRLRLWLLGARPPTLGAAVVPVAVGAAASAHPVAWRTALALVVAVALQVGVNYANDYFDGVRGVDRARVGPLRLTASGLMPARSVARAAGLSVGVALVAGAVLAIAVQPLLLLVGVAGVAGVLLYSGGPAPFGAHGLGEVIVFLFFGPVAVVGTAFVNAGRVPVSAWWASVPIGLLAAALLLVNNLRDIPSDAESGKRTIAVRLGAQGTRILYALLVAVSFAVTGLGVLLGQLSVWTLLMLVAAPLAIPPLRAVRRATGRGLIPALLGTARLHLAAGALLTAGLAIAHS